MKPDISEFSYGYALTEELTQIYPLVGAPEFPSLYREGQLGYDLKLPRHGLPLFIQFKLSDPMVRRNASEADLLGIPYYRMHLHSSKRSAQHSLLLRLEKNGHEVYYAAPMFHLSIKLNESYLKKLVLQNSILVPPRTIGPLPDQDKHYVAFNSKSNIGYFCSEPKPIDLSSATTIINGLTTQLTTSDHVPWLTRDYLLSLGNELLRIYVSNPQWERYQDLFDPITFNPLPFFENVLRRDRLFMVQLRNLQNLRALSNEVEPHQYVRYISRNLYNCEIFFVTDIKRNGIGQSRQ